MSSWIDLAAGCNSTFTGWYTFCLVGTFAVPTTVATILALAMVTAYLGTGAVTIRAALVVGCAPAVITACAALTAYGGMIDPWVLDFRNQLRRCSLRYIDSPYIHMLFHSRKWTLHTYTCRRGSLLCRSI